MYKTLLKLKDIYKYDDWLKMAGQAKDRGKITEEEYRNLIAT